MKGDFKTGDIIINNSGAFGHVLMIYQCEDLDKGIMNARVIHAQSKGGFHKDEIGDVLPGGYENFWCFRPKTLSKAEETSIQEIADKIAKSSVYGAYRAIRLFAGSSSLGPDAIKRLKKYKERLKPGSEKFVSTVTCSEAVILSYQLALPDTDSRFIKVDAAHCMPRTLAKYLLTQAEAWETMHKPI